MNILGKEGNIGKRQSSYFKQNKRAFTLIEVLVDFSILTMVLLAVVSAYTAGFKSIQLAKAKIASVAIANEKMEVIRNMSYDSLATEHGTIYPAGTMLDDEQVTRNNIIFNVHTVISYADDPFDMLAPPITETTCDPSIYDCYPYDYKKAEITVSRVGSSGYLSRLTTNVAAKAAETESNTGILYVCVVDSNSEPLIGATLTIVNMNVNPTVNMSTVTNNDGCIMVANLPPDSHNGYHVTATFGDNYSVDSTNPRTVQNPNAINPDLDIMIQQITTLTLTVDKLGSMKVHIVDEAGGNISGAAVHIEGRKELYFNPSTKKFSKDFTTNENGLVVDNGQEVIDNLEFDNYRITVDGWTVAATSPYQSVQLLAGRDLEVELIATHSTTQPTILIAEPVAGNLNDIVALTVTGSNFGDGLTVKLVNALSNEITGSGVTLTKHGQTDYLDADFDLTGAAIGKYDIVITNPDGSTIRQKNGFEIH